MYARARRVLHGSILRSRSMEKFVSPRKAPPPRIRNNVDTGLPSL